MMKKSEQYKLLRQSIEGTDLIKSILDVCTQLDNINKLLNRERQDLAPVELGTIRARGDILEKMAKIHLKMLAKLLPDLKAVILEDENGTNPLNALIDAIKDNTKNEDD